MKVTMKVINTTEESVFVHVEAKSVAAAKKAMEEAITLVGFDSLKFKEPVVRKSTTVKVDAWT